MKKQPAASQYIEGVIFLTRSGVGYIATNDTVIGEIKIGHRHLRTALHGDYVRALLHPKTRSERQTGEIVSILTRAKEYFVGTVRKEQSVCFVEPQDSRVYTTIVVPPKEQSRVREGDKVLVKIIKWKDGKEAPIGTILENLGKSGAHETEMRAILRDRGIVEDFPQAVSREAQDIKRRYQALFTKEIKKRKDLRSTPTFTIDPEEAKDFDDALSVRKLTNGNLEVGIHIADVSFFVKKKSVLGIEAARRSTSVYLVDRTIPMLPSTLSNNLCSLREGADRLTFSIILEVSKTGAVINRWFGKAIIHSNKRFTYREAQHVLNQKNGTFYTELVLLDTLAKTLQKERKKRGAISFERDEVTFMLDKKGKPLQILKKKRYATNKLIEEFMVLANGEVARFISETNKKIKEYFIYRVHDLPDHDKIHEIRRIMRALGYTIPPHKKKLTSKDISDLLECVKDAAHQEMIHLLAVRAMAKA